MTLLLTSLAFIAMLGPLVALHEWGHYIVARLCGVKVLTYSIGFGPKLLGWTSKRSGIDYRISALPLGGYVKMLDEREGDVKESEKHLAFNNQHPLKKIAIVVAGPLMNLLIAIGLFAVLFMTPSEQLSTRIWSIIPDSYVADTQIQKGDKITAIDGHPVKTWEEIIYRLADRAGETAQIQLQVTSDNQVADVDKKDIYSIDVQNFLQGEQKSKSPLAVIGVTPWQPTIDPVVAKLSEDGAAIRQGLKIDDRIVKIDGILVDDWIAASNIIRANPERLLEFEVLRDSQPVTLNIMPQGKKDTMGNQIGQIGAGVAPVDINVPDDYKVMIQYQPIAALGKAVDKTLQLSVMTLSSIKKMLMGDIGLENLSGPVSIAVIAKQSFDISWQVVLDRAALISLSLAVLNLLPIPVLDGGHMLYYFIELLRGKPLSEKTQIIGFNIGFILLMSMMVIAISMDVTRFF